ncbi:conserved hypothetical protein [Uncinocarpus reesii 1704]|uniref:DNA binding protein SART-1 n=1 Tax=Uncinocarpus reesii (strain UAMH 1704) TaxID=336963 RepID=C4JRQ6_UNCRE|nr:uncharacterized protein UREG_05145 [Uncinocarpus reesii 1704]EEP80303.1 conserved hypothetical protein [Uncinocarpus reesii 1704]
MADALSIEQNNKIRVALGLKPLPVPGSSAADEGPVFKQSKDGDESSSAEDEPGSTLESRIAQGYENWKTLQDEEEAKKKRQARNDNIRRAREAAQRIAKLEGKGLGEVNDDLDTKSWLMQHKKKQKKIEKERARKLAEELAEREQMAEYTSKDLAGVQVAHEISQFDEAGDHILTLKDTTIDENEEEGDQLEDVTMREAEKTEERLELKKKRAAYDPTNYDASGSILAQYDEEIDGKKRRHFTLDAKDISPEEREAKRQDVSSKLKVSTVSLDVVQEATPSDYLDISEIKVKKPKKKKARSTRKRAIDEDDIFPLPDTTETPTGNQSNGDQMEVDGTDANNSSVSALRKRPHDDSSFVDDEDLQVSLAAQRRAAFKKRKRMRPEDIARQLREESEEAANGMDVDQNEDEQPGLVIDETSEFVATLQRPTIPERRLRSVSAVAEEQDGVKSPTPDVKEEVADVDMDRAYNDIEDEEELKERITREQSQADITATGLEEENTLDQGLGATLAMLRQRGLVKESNGGELNSLQRDRQKFLIEKRRRETEAERRARSQRERDRASGKLDRMSARDREEYARWENKQRDQQESRTMADIFNREYKPDVQLKYVDEHGRLMNQKEAFKHLSHQFHGKGSGKMKTEKHLRKIEDEKKREAMSTLDSSQHTGMNNAMGATARRTRQAGVRLA